MVGGAVDGGLVGGAVTGGGVVGGTAASRGTPAAGRAGPPGADRVPDASDPADAATPTAVAAATTAARPQRTCRGGGPVRALDVVAVWPGRVQAEEVRGDTIAPANQGPPPSTSRALDGAWEADPLDRWAASHVRPGRWDAPPGPRPLRGTGT